MRFDWPGSGGAAPTQPPRNPDTEPETPRSTLGSPDVSDDGSDTTPSGKEADRPGGEASNQQKPINAPAPEIPEEEPATTQERNALLRALATWLARAAVILGPEWLVDPRVRLLLAAIEVAEWLAEYLPRVWSYLDVPKTLEELQNAVDQPRFGYETHHIVEAQYRSKNPQSNARQFGRERLESRDNLVRVPYWKHVEISAWYSRPNRDYGGLKPRDYLRGKSWKEQYDVGIDALRDRGVLK